MALSVSSKMPLFGGAIAFLTGSWHLACIVGGPSWVTFARAPDFIIESAERGTYLMPLGAVLISMLFYACTLYALSGAGLIKKIALMRTALIVIASICFVRTGMGLLYLVEHSTDT